MFTDPKTEREAYRESNEKTYWTEDKVILSENKSNQFHQIFLSKNVNGLEPPGVYELYTFLPVLGLSLPL